MSTLLMATRGDGADGMLHTRWVTMNKGVIAREVPMVAFGLELKS